jgi:hypothetical protein
VGNFGWEEEKEREGEDVALLALSLLKKRIPSPKNKQSNNPD